MPSGSACSQNRNILRSGRNFAAFDALDDLGQRRVRLGRPADRLALLDDEAVEKIDFRPPTLEHVLAHRRTLEIAARAGIRAGDHHRLDLGERRAVALGSESEAVGIEIADMLELIAERLAHTHRLAAELNRETADRVVPVAGIAREAGGRGDAIAHPIEAELRPALAPQVGRHPDAVDGGDHLGQLFGAFRHPTVHLADAEDGVLRAAFRHRATDMAGLVEIDGNSRGDTADRLAPTDDAGDALLVETVLQRNDIAVRRQ